MRMSLKVYRLLLKLYPAGFRDEYGGPLQRQFKDDYREVRGARDLIRLWARIALDVARSAPGQLAREIAQDGRHALRLWRRQPLQTGLAIAVLAVAIGATTGVFSVLNALLLRPLPFDNPQRLATFHLYSSPRDMTGGTAFHDWRQHTAYFADAATFSSVEATVEGAGAARRLRLAETSWNFFSVLGTPPVRGRSFQPDEDAPGHGSVAVIGHGLWQDLFGGDPGAVGSDIRVNGVPLRIVGIAPPGFDFPQRSALWTPTTFDWPRIPKAEPAFFWSTVGRLKPDLTWAQARAAFGLEVQRDSVASRPGDVASRPALISLQDQLAGPVRTASLILMAGVALLLLLACANIANLLLARAIGRCRELTIRSALGASRARLSQQLVTETLLLWLVSAAAGLLVARWTVGVATAAQPAQLSSQSYTILDWRVLMFTIAASAVTGLAFGLGPAWVATRGDVAARGRTATPDAAQARTRSLLVAAQVAITIVLVTGSMALGRAFVTLLRIDNGYQLHSIATMSVSPSGTRREAGRADYYAAVLRRVAEVPGVVSASATQSLPLNTDSFSILGYRLEGGSGQVPATPIFISPAYFSTMGGRVLFGREFAQGDLRTDESLVVVNEEFARSLGDPAAIVGRALLEDGAEPRRIIGVVRGMRHTGPLHTPRPQVFRLSRAPRALTIVARVNGPARQRIAAIRDAARSVDPSVPVFNLKTMDERLDTVLARPKFYTTAIVFFGGLGLLLAVMGVYGVVSCSLLQRTREMGIRLALGTTPARLRAATLAQTFITVGAGAAAGIAAAAAFGRYLRSLVQGADAAMFPTAALAVLVTAVIAALAIWTATRHLARLDIADVLRAEVGD
jgi:predicted permease